MKRLIWLLALPYVVTFSTYSTSDWWSPDMPYSVTGKDSDTSFRCNEKGKDFCYDMAEALNEAHERRTKSKYIYDIEYKEGPPTPINIYHRASGGGSLPRDERP